jgi:hypothetical protein
MAIGSAIERRSLIVVFSEHEVSLVSKAKGSGPKRFAGILWFHRHRTLRVDHLHVRREGYDAVLEGGMTDRMTAGKLFGWAGHYDRLGRMAFG